MLEVELDFAVVAAVVVLAVEVALVVVATVVVVVVWAVIERNNKYRLKKHPRSHSGSASHCSPMFI